MNTAFRLTRLAIVAAIAPPVLEDAACACGCFANPPAVTTSPAIQAGERILFSVENGQVTATIQIAFTGQASDFGWLLPLPSIPTLEAGTDELFARLEPVTTPTYLLSRTFTCNRSDTACVGLGSGD